MPTPLGGTSFAGAAYLPPANIMPPHAMPAQQPHGPSSDVMGPGIPQQVTTPTFLLFLSFLSFFL